MPLPALKGALECRLTKIICSIQRTGDIHIQQNDPICDHEHFSILIGPDAIVSKDYQRLDSLFLCARSNHILGAATFIIHQAAVGFPASSIRS